MKTIKPTPQSSADTPINRAQRRAIRFKRVQELVPLCESQLYVMVARGDFPKPFQLVPGSRSRAVAWWENDILEWLEQRAAASQEGK